MMVNFSQSLMMGKLSGEFKAHTLLIKKMAHTFIERKKKFKGTYITVVDSESTWPCLLWVVVDNSNTFLESSPKVFGNIFNNR